MKLAFSILALLAFFTVSLAVFVPFWGAILKMMAKRSGWKLLAETYPSRRRPHGKTFRFQSLRLGRGGYSNALTFVISPSGFYLAAWGPFRFGHAPILIPWSEISKVNTMRVMGFRFIEFEVGAPLVAKLQISPRVFDAAKGFLKPGIVGQN